MYLRFLDVTMFNNIHDTEGPAYAGTRAALLHGTSRFVEQGGYSFLFVKRNLGGWVFRPWLFLKGSWRRRVEEAVLQ